MPPPLDQAPTSAPARAFAGSCLRQRIPVFNAGDLLTTRSHTHDFSGSRGDFIGSRVRYIAILGALLFPVWIPVDFWLLGADGGYLLAPQRIAAALGCLGLALASRREDHNLTRSLARLSLLLVMIGLFYLFSRATLPAFGSAGLQAEGGYRFFPFIMAALLAVFPLTLFEGLTLIGGVALLAIGVTLRLGSPPEVYLPDLWLLLLLCAIALWSQMSQLQLLLRLHLQATRDPLTCLFNRRVFLERLEEESASVLARGGSLSLMMFDLDRFKRINDNYGHLAGDEVLRTFAAILRRYSGESALLCRYGGEEFVALLPDVPGPTARELAERIRHACHQAVARPSKEVEIRFTTSIGVAERRSDETATALLNRVDCALYAAKEAGRDMVVEAEGGAPPSG